MSCIFCDRSKIKDLILYETSYALILLNKLREKEGQIIVVSKEHYDDLTAVPYLLYAIIQVLAKGVWSWQRERNEFVSCSIVILEGEQAGGQIKHSTHIHVIPLKEGDQPPKSRAEGGIREEVKEPEIEKYKKQFRHFREPPLARLLKFFLPLARLLKFF